MHELSIAASIVELAAEEAKNRRARVRAVHLKLGPLSGVVKEALLGSFEIAAAGTPLEQSRLVIRDVPIVVFCSACDRRSEARLQSLACPACGGTADVVEGAELEVTALEIET